MKRQENRAWIVGNVAYIDVSTARHPRAIALVGATDLERVLDGRGRWRAKGSPRSSTVYAWRWAGPRARREYVFLHRFVLGLKRGDGQLTDHVNRDGLDCRRENLRIASPSQNAMNVPRDRVGLRGVRHRAGRWHAQIRIAGKQIFLGSFPSQEQAADAYDRAARAAHGEFAITNGGTPA